MRDFVARQQAAPAADEEHFRLLTGFNDIFVSIAALLLLAAVAWLGSIRAPALGGAAVAVVSWGLAEYFTRQRRMALPSIVLLLGFVGGVFECGVGIFISAGLQWNELGLAASAAAATLAAYLHWRRFMVPITVAAGTAAAVGTLLALLLGFIPQMQDYWHPLLLFCGLGVFGWAMRWDASDRARMTRRADIAFWLHLSAAPMIVHPAFAMLGLLGPTETNVGRAGAAVAIYLVLAVLALAVDRRALLVSALIYALYATAALFRAAGSLSTSFALTALVIGSALLLLSAFWQRSRKLVVGRLPLALQARLPIT